MNIIAYYVIINLTKIIDQQLTPLLFIAAFGTLFGFIALGRTAIYNPEIMLVGATDVETFRGGISLWYTMV